MLYRLEHHEHGVELYNCCFEPAYTIQYIVEAMKKVTGLTQFVPDIPNWVIMPMARAAMFLGSPMGICPARVKKLQISTNICGEKLKNCSYQFKWSFDASAVADYKKMLASYDKIAVREKTAVEMLNEWGLENSVGQVLDPSLLLDKSEQMNLIVNKNDFDKCEDQNYILVYQIHNDPKQSDYAKRLAKHTGMELVRVNP